jgi:hypothetical protein
MKRVPLLEAWLIPVPEERSAPDPLLVVEPDLDRHAPDVHILIEPQIGGWGSRLGR